LKLTGGDVFLAQSIFVIAAPIAATQVALGRMSGTRTSAAAVVEACLAAFPALFVFTCIQDAPDLLLLFIRSSLREGGAVLAALKGLGWDVLSDVWGLLLTAACGVIAPVVVAERIGLAQAAARGFDLMRRARLALVFAKICIGVISAIPSVITMSVLLSLRLAKSPVWGLTAPPFVAFSMVYGSLSSVL
jgi:hypothetical protein